MTGVMSLKKYYAIGLIPYILIVIIFLLIDFSFASKLYFYLSYFWSFYLLAPGNKETISKKRYRFAFVKFIYLLDKQLQKINKQNIPYIDSLIRSLSPFLFVAIIYSIGRQGNLFFAILGALTFEIIFLSYTKLYKQSA